MCSSGKNWFFTQSLSAADLGFELRKEYVHRLCLVHVHWSKTERLSEQNSNDYKNLVKNQRENGGQKKHIYVHCTQKEYKKEYWTN
jgi:hypothetical protein